jgi:hypothetical protein
LYPCTPRKWTGEKNCTSCQELCLMSRTMPHLKNYATSQELCLMSRTIPHVKNYTSCQELYLMSRTITHVKNCTSSQELYLMSRTVPHVKNCTSRQELYLMSSLNSAFNADQFSASPSGRFRRRGNQPSTHWLGGWAERRARLDVSEKRKNRESNPSYSSPSPSHYTDSVIHMIIEKACFPKNGWSTNGLSWVASCPCVRQHWLVRLNIPGT